MHMYATSCRSSLHTCTYKLKYAKDPAHIHRHVTQKCNWCLFAKSRTRTCAGKCITHIDQNAKPAYLVSLLVIEALLQRLDVLQEALFVDERQKSNPHPRHLLAVHVHSEILWIEVDYRRVRSDHEFLILLRKCVPAQSCVKHVEIAKCSGYCSAKAVC